MYTVKIQPKVRQIRQFSNIGSNFSFFATFRSNLDLHQANTILNKSASIYLMQTCSELYLPDEDPDWIETLQGMRSLSQYWRTVWSAVPSAESLPYTSGFYRWDSSKPMQERSWYPNSGERCSKFTMWYGIKSLPSLCQRTLQPLGGDSLDASHSWQRGELLEWRSMVWNQLTVCQEVFFPGRMWPIMNNYLKDLWDKGKSDIGR